MTDEEADAIALARLADCFQRAAIPAIIRRSSRRMFGGRPIIALIKEGKIEEVARTVRDWLDDWDGLN